MSQPKAGVDDVIAAINAGIAKLEETHDVQPQAVLGAVHFVRISTETQMELEVRTQLGLRT